MIFNTPFETALRILLLLETEARDNFTINMIAALDFAALYGKSFEVSEENLHGDNLFKFSEFATRKELANEGIKLLVRKGFVNAGMTQSGFVYRITDEGRIFAGKLDTAYADDYRNEIRSALRYFSDMSEQGIINRINKLAVSSLEKEVAAFHEE